MSCTYSIRGLPHVRQNGLFLFIALMRMVTFMMKVVHNLSVWTLRARSYKTKTEDWAAGHHPPSSSRGLSWFLSCFQHIFNLAHFSSHFIHITLSRARVIYIQGKSIKFAVFLKKRLRCTCVFHGIHLPLQSQTGRDAPRESSSKHCAPFYGDCSLKDLHRQRL